MGYPVACLQSELIVLEFGSPDFSSSAHSITQALAEAACVGRRLLPSEQRSGVPGGALWDGSLRLRKGKFLEGLSRLLSDLFHEAQEGLAKHRSQLGENRSRHQALGCGPREVHGGLCGISSCCVS